MTSRLQIDPARLNALLSGPSGPVYRAVDEFARAIVEEVKERGPIGFDQDGARDIGALREDMSIRRESRTPTTVTITVGTDPVNRGRNTRGGGYDYHYAAAVHLGRAAIDSASVMRFVERGGIIRWTHHVGPARAVPFLYEAVARANGTPGPKFNLREEIPSGPA